MSKIFTLIGSRQTPKSILDIMVDYALYFYNAGYGLRSGGADGADKCGEYVYKAKNKGSDNPRIMEIYLPWKGFNKNNSPLFSISAEAWELASKIHPVWNQLNTPSKLLHSRNILQILGQNLDDPTSFVICYTPDGKASGGTATAMRLAESYNIDIYNLYHNDDRDRLDTFINLHEIFDDPISAAF